MITYGIEDFVETLPELRVLLPLHWEELALDKDKVPLDPQFDIYRERSMRGEVLLATIREDGDLIGYFIGFVGPGLHYRTCLTLQMDIFYVKKGKRTGSHGLKLFKCVEREALRRGVQRWFMGSKLHRDSGALFKRLGFEPIETYYSKWLGA